MNRLIKKANVLIEALPYIRTFKGKTIVIKYGGHAMTDAPLKERFAQDVVLLKYVGLNPVIVHGGGPQIDKMLQRLDIAAKFRHGVRVTDEATMEIVEMVLAGKINMEIVDLLNRHGGLAVGLSGKDGGLMLSRPLTAKAWAASLDKDLEDGEEDEDFGLVGEVQSIDPTLVRKLQQDHYIPVIAPIGTDREGNTYNINADLVAGAMAAALSAEKAGDDDRCERYSRCEGAPSLDRLTQRCATDGQARHNRRRDVAQGPCLLGCARRRGRQSPYH